MKLIHSAKRFLHRIGLGPVLGLAPLTPTLPELPLQPDAADAERARITCEFLDGVQGGILSAKARGKHVALWLFKFDDPAAHTRNAAAVNAAADRVTTAKVQCRDRVGGKFRSLALSGSGLLACGINDQVRDGSGFCPPDMMRWLLDGMGQPTELAWNHDPIGPDGTTPSTWEAQFQKRIDGAWLLGAGSPDALNALELDTVKWGAARGLAEVAVERGKVRKEAGKVREAFGFVDGISTQRFFRTVPNALPTPLDKVVLTTARHFGSSFLVLRKLEQNVKAFLTYRTAVGDAKAAEVIGRSRDDGVPLASRAPGAALNDFDFTNDAGGARCPFTAHIRRANPRAVHDDGALAPQHLVRRGVVYGPDELLDAPEGAEAGVGLMFMAYMSDLNTFRTIQGAWFATPGFPVAPQPPGAADALIFGPLPGMGAGLPPSWVTPRGGAYLFVPSRSWMRALSPEIP